MTAFTLRPTRIDDVAALPAIERAAGSGFATFLSWPGLPTARSFPLRITSAMPREDQAGWRWQTTGRWGLFSPKPIHRRCLLWNSLFIRTGRDAVSDAS